MGNWTRIVGYNNAGKSNIMSAIEWLILPKALTSSDFYDASRAVSIESVIEGLSEALLYKLDARYRAKLLPFIKKECLRIRRNQQQPGGSVSNVVEWEVRKLGVVDENKECQPNPTGIFEPIQALFPEPIFIGAMQDAAVEDATKSKTSATFGKLLAEFTNHSGAATWRKAARFTGRCQEIIRTR